MMSFFTLFSQTKGIVLDANNKPLNEVNILFSDQNILLFSNEDGEFITELDIPNNSYISFYKDGYSSKTLKYKSGVELKIILEKLHIILDEVGVVESHSELGNSRLINIEPKKTFKKVFKILKGEKCIKRGAHVGGNHGDEYMPQFINFFKENLL